MNAYFGYVHSDESSFDVPKEGGSRTFVIDQYLRYADLRIACDGEEMPDLTFSSGEMELNDWISVNYQKDVSKTMDNNSLEVTVKENTGESRKAVITLSDADGVSFDLAVNQEGLIISSVQQAFADVSGFRVVGDDIFVDTDTVVRVDVYDVSGLLRMSRLIYAATRVLISPVLT